MTHILTSLLHFTFFHFLRYQIIYTWKILEGIAPNVGIKSYTSVINKEGLPVPSLPNKTVHLVKLAFKLGVQQPSSKYKWPDRMLRDQFQAQT